MRIDALPDEAWQFITGGPDGDSESAAYWDANKLKRAAMTSQIPTVFTRVGSDVEVEDIGIDINPLYGGLPSLIFQISLALDTKGAAYWGVDVQGSTPRRVRWFTPTSVQPVYDKTGGRGLLGFERGLGTSTIRYAFNEDEMRAMSDDAGWLGWVWELGLPEMGPGMALEKYARLPVDLLRKSDEVLWGLYKRGLIEAHFVTAETNPPEAEKERILDRLRRTLAGVGNAHNVDVFSSGLNVQKIGTSPREMDMSAIDAGNQLDVSAVADTPQSLLTGNANNRSVLDRLTQNWILYTIMPRAERIASALNLHVFKPAGYEMHLQPESLTILQEEEHLRSQSLVNLTSSGVPLMVALDTLGFDLNDNQRAVIEQAEQDKQAMAEQIQEATAQPQPTDGEAGEDEEAKSWAWDDEAAQFRRWYKKRPGADVDDFKANHLTHADKLVIQDEVLRASLQDYP